jgi:hypothetical protein
LCLFVWWLIRLIWNSCSVAIMLLLFHQILLIFVNPRMQIIFLFSQKVSLIVKTHITKVENMVKQLWDLGLQQPKVIVMSKVLSNLPAKYHVVHATWDSVADVNQNLTTLSTWSMKKLNSSLILMLPMFKRKLFILDLVMLHLTKFMIQLVGLHLQLPTLHNLLLLLCNISNMLNIVLILRSVCDVIVVVNMVIVNEKPRNLMMLIKHIKLFLPFLMDLFLLLILFSIAHMLHMLSFLPMMLPSMLSMMLLNTRHSIMLDNPIQVRSNHIVCVGDICVLCGLLNQWEPCTSKNMFNILTFYRSSDW